MATKNVDPFATPLHIQRLEQSLRLEPLLNYIENVINHANDSELETSGTDGELDMDPDKPSVLDEDGNRIYNGIVVSKAERKADKNRLYNFGKVKKSRKWLKNVLLSDSSSGEEEQTSQDDINNLLEIHNYQKTCRKDFHKDEELHQYKYFSTGLLSSHDKFHEHQKSILGPKKKLAKEQKKLEKKLKKAKLKKLKQEQPTTFPGSSNSSFPEHYDGDEEREDGELTYEELRLQQMLYGEHQPLAMFHNVANQPTTAKTPKNRRLTQEQLAAKRRRVWVAMCKKEIPKAAKQKAAIRKEGLSNLKKVGKECQKEYRRSALVSQKLLKEGQVRARRLAKEAQAYWKRFEKVEKEHRKKAEKEAIEQRKVDLEVQEMKRQQRKLNFLITQTELYAHFMAKKLTGESEEKKEAILSRLDDEDAGSHKTAEVSGGALTNVGGLDNYNPKDAKDKVLKTADTAYRKHKQKTELFDATINKKAPSSIFADPSLSVDNIPQPSVLQCKLKGYQVKGLNWLASLYNQGINGILADEMGLGKTVQSISFLAHLAESHGIWGPFLVVAPASTLHNWQQELTKFMPTFKVVPYWGNTQDRKVLRKFFSSDQPFHSKEASFHVAITSYQLIIQDAKYFHRIKWHYMVLDEAQAIKSVSSVRWKMLLGFNCRNRLLLTGTPIQNSMQELWALLHYIMPTLFDSHEEFNDWFSKDIESHAERQSGIDEKHLSRLHMILKPFMLRRCKKDVENELSDKIEVIVYCPLTKRQRYLYQAIKNKIRIEDLLSSTTGQMQGSSSLMNLVMQFRKVCNHPELFERREVRSPMYVKLDPYLVPKLVYREALLDKQIPSKNHLLLNKLHIFNPHHIHTSLSDTSSTSGTSCFAFSRFCDLSVGELSAIMLLGLLARWKHLFKLHTVEQILHHRHTYAEIKLPSRCIGREGFLLQPLRTISFPNLRSRRVSPVLLPPLVFTTSAASVHCHGNVTLHCMKETAAHRKIRNRRRSGKDAAASLVVAGGDTPTSPPLGECKSPTGMRAGAAGVMPAGRKPPTSPTKASKLASLAAMDESLHPHIPRPPQVLEMMPLEVPHFLYKVMPKTQSPYLEAYSIDRSSAWDSYRVKLCGTLEAKQSLLYGSPQHLAMARRSFFSPSPLQGLGGIRPKYGYSGVSVPDKETMVTDAGKLYVLDSLLGRLKQEGHRVLIYSQMTRMIDLLEEYMWHRRHTYMRLDGSSKISDRRDMVNDFQSRSDIFVFLLSTRAGGLGINLTAADTVIFYDSDWNPTVDQQAMDRAHRLGQTKQVTVYRLICKGTIEERIIQRAQEKSEIQKMVIEGGDVRPDVLRPKEVVSLLLDDEEIEKKLKKKQEDEGYIDFGHTVKRKKSGRGPGRPPKKKKLEEEAVQNQTIPAVPPPSTPSFFDMDPASPMSGISESTQQSLATATAADDSSNDGLVIVDDAHTTFPPVTSPATPSSSTGKRGRPRGRPRGSGGGRGSGTPRRSRGRGSVQKAIMAAESAAVRAGKTAAFAAYGYNFQSDPSSPLVPGRGGASPRGRGRGVAMRGRGIGRPPQT